MPDPQDTDDDEIDETDDPGSDELDPEAPGNDAIPDEDEVGPAIVPDDDDDDDEPDTFSLPADGEDLV